MQKSQNSQLKVSMIIDDKTADLNVLSTALLVATAECGVKDFSTMEIKVPVKHSRVAVIRALKIGYDVMIVCCGGAGGKFVRSAIRAMNTVEVPAAVPIALINGLSAKMALPKRRVRSDALRVCARFVDIYNTSAPVIARVYEGA